MQSMIKYRLYGIFLLFVCATVFSSGARHNVLAQCVDRKVDPTQMWLCSWCVNGGCNRCDYTECVPPFIKCEKNYVPILDAKSGCYDLVIVEVPCFLVYKCASQFGEICQTDDNCFVDMDSPPTPSATTNYNVVLTNCDPPCAVQ